MKHTINTALFLFAFFTLANIQAQKGILLENFNLIDGTGTNIQKNKSLLIVADTIHSIFDFGKKVPIDNYDKIDLTGKYLLPGLFDAHTHLAANPSNKNLSTVKKQLNFMVSRGITGVRDMAGDARILSYLARQAFTNEIMSPDIYYSALMGGPRFFSRDRRVIRGSKGIKVGDAPWMQSVDRNTDIKLAVARAKGSGATGIKLYSSLNGDLINRITEEAHKQDLLVWAHAAIFPVLPSNIVDANVNGLSHSTLWSSEQLVRMPEKGKRPIIDTVLTKNAPKLEALAVKMAQKNVYLDPTVLAFKNARPKSLYNNGTLASKIAFDKGVKLIVGTDRPYDVTNTNNLPLIEEMAALVNDAGIPALEIIKAATKNSADFLKIGNEVGTIKIGKRANILIVDENPLDDMKNLFKVFKVFKNGLLINNLK